MCKMILDVINNCIKEQSMTIIHYFQYSVWTATAVDYNN